MTSFITKLKTFFQKNETKKKHKRVDWDALRQQIELGHSLVYLNINERFADMRRKKDGKVIRILL